MPRDWRQAADYADVQDLDLSGLAWEFLRRSPSYANAYAGAVLGLRDDQGRDPTWRFGLRFPLDPAVPAVRAELFWRADVATAHVIPLGPARHTGLAPDDVLPLALAARRADDGLHLRLRRGVQLLIPPDIGRDAALGALLDLDQAVNARVAALRAFVQLLGAPRPPADGLSAHGRRRIVLILRALDARAALASYRDIARDILGADDAAAGVDWRISSVRDVAIRLCRSGRRMMGGGYRRLLARR